MTTTPSPTTRRHRVSAVIGVIGELLITAGVFVFLFLGWQLWLNDLIVGGAQQKDAVEFGRELGSDAESPDPLPSGDAKPEDAAPDGAPGDAAAPGQDFGEPVVSSAVAEKERFANLYVPRFGKDYVRTIAEGVDTANVLKTGIGHYPGTQLPGEIGNFAVAAHRTTYGAPFNRIADLRVGDRMYVQTSDGWYTYVFRSLEYVPPTGIEVLEPVPQVPGATAIDRFITLTSCNPMLSAAERIIAYGVYDSWQPASAGPPEEIAALATGVV